ncbi:unnamed protein product, partial [Rotaria sp. Silwood1]
IFQSMSYSQFTNETSGCSNCAFGHVSAILQSILYPSMICYPTFR